MKCRHCGTPLEHIFLDLGSAPPSNAYLTVEDLKKPEISYPLKLLVCTKCWLVQTEDYTRPEVLFSPEYAYFSSTSSSWLEHAARYSDMIIERLGLNENRFVIEVASNDGYLLKNFVESGIPCLGIEPTDSTAEAAEKIGITVLREFFSEATGKQLAKNGQMADLIIGNNVYAHVPDINDFTSGLKAVLKPGGTITLEFPHLMRLIENTLFDTVYHEHYSYLSLYTVNRILTSFGLRIWDVEELSTHGGSLRVYGCHAEDPRPSSPLVNRLLEEESRKGLQDLKTYQDFQSRAERIKNEFLLFLLKQKQAGKRVIGYGAAAKGNTLLNFAGVKPDLLPFICDAAPSKQGKYMPGSHIPILHPNILDKYKPDVILVFPWNILKEVMDQLDYVRIWGGSFATAIPIIKVFS